jgi:hypothetical protein
MRRRGSEMTLLEAVEALLKIGKSGYYNPHTNDCVFCWHNENESEVCADNCEWFAVEKAAERSRGIKLGAEAGVRGIVAGLTDSVVELRAMLAEKESECRALRGDLEDSQYSSGEKAREIADLKEEVRRGKAEAAVGGGK